MPERHQLSGPEKEIIHSIAYEEELISIHWYPETLYEKIEILRPRMIEKANEGKKISYEELTDGFHVVPHQDIGRILGIAGLLEHRKGNPLLPAVVTNKDVNRVGPGFFKLAEKAGFSTPDREAERREFWRSHLTEVWEHDWS